VLASSKGRDQLLSHVGSNDGTIYLVSNVSTVFHKEASWETGSPVLCLKYLSQKLLAIGHPSRYVYLYFHFILFIFIYEIFILVIVFLLSVSSCILH
jgi:hypothetical protein